jgi:CHAD domain-containing protein
LLTSKSFEYSFKNLYDSLEGAVGAYLKGPIPPTEESVHDLRISIRRIRAAYAILPKSERKKKKELATFVKACNLAFRVNSPVRDIDVMSSRIARVGEHNESKIDPRTELARERIMRLPSAIKKVGDLIWLQKPEISIELSDKKIDERLRKRIKQLKKKSREILPVVLKEESKADDLHLLRKTYKMLRYTLELDSPLSSKKAKDMLKVLKERQAILGEIHDSDITLSLLKNDHLVTLNDPSFIRSEKELRHRNYQAFVGLCAESEI